jgi:hypothetical protein
MNDEPADLRARVEQLEDGDAISALLLLLESENQNTSDAALEGASDEFAAALASPGVREQLEQRAQDTAALAQSGELARLTLIAISEDDDERRQRVAYVIDRPAGPGMRDPFTLAIIGAVVLALRPKVHIGKKPGQGWTVDFKTEPLKDSTMGKVIGKLLSVGSSSPTGP